MSHLTKVIFRRWRSGDKAVIALFPEQPAELFRPYCNSYEHLGQHGSADANFVVSKTRLAKKEEYAELKRELERIGYKLKICKKLTPAMRETLLDVQGNFRDEANSLGAAI